MTAFKCLVVQLRCSRLAAADLLHQKDYAIRCLCDDKFNASLELLELFAKDELFGGVSTPPKSHTFSFFCRLQRSIWFFKYLIVYIFSGDSICLRVFTVCFVLSSVVLRKVSL